MKPGFLFAAGIAAAAMLPSGCCYRRLCAARVNCEPPYWRVVTTDVRGCWIAEWIAENPVKKAGEGYCFWAVQRRIFRPYVLTFRYPLGRFVKVEAPNIIITSAAKPQWLCELERYEVLPDQCRRTPRRANLHCGYFK